MGVNIDIKLRSGRYIAWVMAAPPMKTISAIRSTIAGSRTIAMAILVRGPVGQE
jgi:hypothetical protein